MAAGSRKNVATSTATQAQQATAQSAGPYANLPDLSQLSNDQFLSWGANNNSVPSYADSTGVFGVVAGVQDLNQSTADHVPTLQHQDSQLVRRNLNRELTVRGRNDQMAQQQAQPNEWLDGATGAVINLDEDNESLTERAAAAQKDAQSKRPPKSIPPFIQKLSSFLDQSRNTDLIRWSDDGNSFIVLDEDRFANELIPELFKHNNYASFVRQLNMYGFHKNVGLSDNSMRASETKSKRPSVYSNPYFKRGRPELLWLITKPKNDGSTMKKKKGKAGVENGDSDDDIKDGTEGIGRLDMTQVSQGAFNSLQREVAQLQRNQQQITAVLTRLRDENNQYLRQAGTMVAAHERHENSINAILTFLATFYNRSQEGQGNLGAMFSGGIPDNQPHGNIVDMGDFDGPSNVTTPEPNNMQLMRTPSRRPLAILPPPEAQARSTSAAPNPALHNRNTSSAGLQVPQQRAQPNGARSTASAQSTPTPAPPSPANRVDDMMNVINNANAARSSEPQNAARAANSAGSPQFDFDAALQHFQTSNGSAPLTNEQRASVLSMMASNSGTSTPQIPALNAGAVNPWASGMEHFQNNSAQIDLLQRMQEEQDWKMSNLADRLQPLSPSGSIPGLEGLTTPSLSRMGSLNLGSAPDMNTMAAHGIPHLKQAPSSDFDINKFLNADYFPEDDGTGDNYNPDSGANFDFDGDLGDQSVFEQPHAAGLIDEEGPGNNDTDMSGFVLHDDPGNSNTSTPGRIGGRVLGSVGSSAGSGINSPRVKTEDEDEATSLAAAHQQQSTTLPVDMRTKKRRRVGE